MKTSSIDQVKKLYQKTADSYDKMMDGEIEHPVYSDTLKRLADRIVDIPGPVIDTSCGSGHMLYLYHERFDPQRPLIGVDLSPRMVEITNEKLGSHAETFIADMRDLGKISSGSSAAVLSFFCYSSFRFSRCSFGISGVAARSLLPGSTYNCYMGGNWSN